MLDLPFAEQMAHLRRRLAAPLPGPAAQVTMAPATRQDLSLLEVEEKTCREAAVLALLFPSDDVTTVLLTARPDHLPDHAGQISFPGGRREPGETLQQTALREAHEEVGLPPDAVDVLGALTPLYIPPSNYCVYPFVGTVPQVPALRPMDAEVAALLYVPLPLLLAPDTRCEAHWTIRGRRVAAPYFAVDGYEVWGATAMMLAELLALFREVQDF